MIEVIGLTGYAQSGKDTAAGFLVEAGWTKLAFADPLRAAVFALNPIIYSEGPSQGNAEHHYVHVQDAINSYGYEFTKAKYPEYRELLQRMGTEVGRDQFGENFWVERVTSQFKPGGKYVVSDVRFPNEANAVRGHGGKVFRIFRPGTGAVNAHVSDTGIDRLGVDEVITNASDLDAFRVAVLEAAGIV